jgi:hypothetical protein
MSDPWKDEQALQALRGNLDDSQEGLRRVSQELLLRADADQVAPPERFEMPWSPERHARNQARDAALEARLDLFRDDLRSIRIANEVLNRASTMRAVEAAETAIFEVRSRSESFRLHILNSVQLAMTQEFIAHIDRLESFRERMPNEILDALKERALNEFTSRMNRASKSDVEFPKDAILRLKPEE